MERPAFSERAGRTSRPPLTVRELQIAFLASYKKFLEAHYFLSAFGKSCPDDNAPGDRGMSLEEAVVLRFSEERDLRITERRLREMSGDDIFDLIEFLHDAAAKPTETWFHDYYSCGIHVTAADYGDGAKEWREELNPYLSRIDPPFRIVETGEVQLVPTDVGMKAVVDERPASGDAANIDERVSRAVSKFFGRHSTHDDQKEAIRLLADVLEFLRKDVEQKLTNKDSSDLFQIANRYAIRHHDGKQITGYDPSFYPWMFQVYLATINLVVRLKAASS